ncbi:MAG: prolipoprotein diacylglyceryl transferase [Synergistaceae bacterium]|nr:prolipoprotein diacylglyceryl transferase [Synergistaceae bacterium]
MYPVLLKIGSITIDSYSVVWFIALTLAILWVTERLKLYGIDEDPARRIMAVSFIFMFLGAIIFKQPYRIPLILADPSMLVNYRSWGVSEFGAVSGAFVSALVMCMFSRKVSFMRLCDAALPPAMLAISVGRWGCFLNGCCVGRVTDFFTGVHFPGDHAGVLRHPVQIYYSVIAAVIVLVLLHVERRVLPLQKDSKKYYPVIAPLGMILYALMRITVSFVRDSRPFTWLAGHSLTYKTLLVILPFVCLWLAHSIFRLKAGKSCR